MKESTTRILTRAAMTAALEIMLNRFASINTLGLKIGFSFVPIALCAMLSGPWVAGACYALADFLGAHLFPLGPYSPGFTVMAFAMGAVYGLFLYKKESLRLFPDILAPTLINCLIIGLCVNTLWVSVLYGSRTYWGWFVYRLAQYAVLIPVHLSLLPLLGRLSHILKKRGAA
ncbi:MAG: folate family ECF transporter S component [Oscillospiraceae bacterium]|nr:folate family ECF transporter S component [Oscillospiraceae bacterium]